MRKTIPESCLARKLPALRGQIGELTKTRHPHSGCACLFFGKNLARAPTSGAGGASANPTSAARPVHAHGKIFLKGVIGHGWGSVESYGGDFQWWKVVVEGGWAERAAKDLRGKWERRMGARVGFVYWKLER